MKPNHNEIVSKIYETILCQGAWREALSMFADAANAKSSVLLVTDDNNLHYECVAASDSWSRRNIFDYWRNFYALEADIFRKLSKKNLREFVLDYDFRSRPSDYWQQPISIWMQDTLGVMHRGGAGLHAHNGWMGVATLQFDSSKELIDKREFLEINGYFHHISKAVEIGRTISHTTKLAKSTSSALDNLAQSIVIVDQHNRATVQNVAAQKLLDAQDGIYVDAADTLKLNNPQSQKELEDLLAACRTRDTDRLQLPPQPILLPRSSGKPSYIVEATPLVDTGNLFDSGTQAVMLSVTDPVADYKISVSGLSKLYKLTRTEGIVTEHLVSGYSIKEISARRNTSEDTVRTQVKSILSKTNTASQTSLIRLAHVLNPPFLDNN